MSLPLVCRDGLQARTYQAGHSEAQNRKALDQIKMLESHSLLNQFKRQIRGTSGID